MYIRKGVSSKNVVDTSKIGKRQIQRPKKLASLVK